MKLAFSTLACPGWSLERCLEVGAGCGYEGVEIRLVDGRLVDATMGADERRRVAQGLKRGGLPVAALDSSVLVASDDPEGASRDLRAFLELAAEWQAPAVRVFGGSLPPQPEARAARFASAARVLTGAAAVAETLGVRIGVETHDDFLSSATVAELLAMVQHPMVGAVWDSHHPVRAGEAPAETYARIGSRLVLAQVKDAVGTPGERKGWRLVLLGRGDVPVREILGLLAAGGYEGWVSVEWEKHWWPELEPPEVALPQHVRVLRQWLSEIAGGAAARDARSAAGTSP